MARLSNIVNNLAEGIHEIKWANCNTWICTLEYTIAKDHLECICLCWNENKQQKFDKILKERFANTSRFNNHDIKKLFLLLHKGVYLYEYGGHWEKPNETLPEKQDSYNHLNMEDITDADYKHSTRVCENFEIKPLCESYHLYIQGDTLLLANVLNNFWNMYLKMYELDPARFKIFSAPGLAWQAALKNTKIKLGLLTDIDVINGRKTYLRRNISCYSLCKMQ